MIKNVAQITYDWREIRNNLQRSNIIKIFIYNPILNVCVCNGRKNIYVNIYNNTKSDLYCLNVIDYNNNFKYKIQKAVLTILKLLNTRK